MRSKERPKWGMCGRLRTPADACGRVLARAARAARAAR
ncbi:Hypothetical protein CAP_6100 [Chondromyces apiculatus DSM 436]|uniref:Uncharacterized protein n=1 Tax=Chondromyces apiculatus DSM 436 TaxID=1192034 RepID=A0A017TGG7_9BACT|nr:Hypothetical protein CAP_6100 [Chondromyces apiculatus DSM 436]